MNIWPYPTRNKILYFCHLNKYWYILFAVKDCDILSSSPIIAGQIVYVINLNILLKKGSLNLYCQSITFIIIIFLNIFYIFIYYIYLYIYILYIYYIFILLFMSIYFIIYIKSRVSFFPKNKYFLLWSLGKYSLLFMVQSYDSKIKGYALWNLTYS